jgi:hypothetical protein
MGNYNSSIWTYLAVATVTVRRIDLLEVALAAQARISLSLNMEVMAVLMTTVVAGLALVGASG